MGALFSAPEPSSAPRSFYLVLSGPPIRHSRPGRGPLIFHVDHTSSQPEELVEHAEVIRPTCSFPSRQPLVFTRSTSAGSSSTFSFFIDASLPPRSVTVYTEAALIYSAGDGITVRPKAQSQPQFVALRQGQFEPLEPEAAAAGRAKRYTLTVPAVQESTLVRVGAVEGRQRLDFAPVVIVVEYSVDKTPQEGDDEEERGRRDRRATPQKKSVSGGRSVSPTMMAESRENAVSPISPDQGGCGIGSQFICLNISENRQELTVLKQLLVHNGELFELDEVYGLDTEAGGGVSPQAAEDDAATTAAAGPLDAADDDSDTVCVVCLTNPKDTMILPCRHLCLCSECAGPLKQQTNKCPMCRAKIDRLMTR